MSRPTPSPAWFLVKQSTQDGRVGPFWGPTRPQNAPPTNAMPVFPNLPQMAKLGLNVPPGFTITTDACAALCASADAQLPPGLWDDVLAALAVVERAAGARFGDADAPLLLSVRSGAALSMPGMMNTVLNLGLTPDVVAGLAATRGDRFALDCHRRFIDMYADVVLGVPHDRFEKEIDALKARVGVKYDTELTADHLRDLVAAYERVLADAGASIPAAPLDQLRAAVTAVFRSWLVPRAVKYREINHIFGLAGTACNIQAMVYGNASDASATGVCFSRSPSDGTPGLYGEWLRCAQGEDVVAGIRTPVPVAELAAAFPECAAALDANVALLEKHYKDLQDVEFTIQEGELFMLQCRVGKRTGAAALKIALDMEKEVGKVD